ncbi:hypothetical protein TanjilG_04603 [Lupinus angustifolius]|uniref:DNA polymerase II subunit 2 n=1 Tax=Lupinus angustifolius TaxID=3871 RepID=A0A4P1RQ89_LUPAN|nr:hypothetical protein TanjilG_04603 [Lupinus angustifolius]
MSASTRKKVQRKSKIRGYNLKVDALDEILSFVSRFPNSDHDEAIDLLLDQLDHESLKSTIVDKELVQRLVSLLWETDEAVGETSVSFGSSSRSSICVVDAFDIPKFQYDPIRKQFYEHTSSLPVHGEASAKEALYRDRFLLLTQRLSRDQHFSKPAFDSEFSHFGSCEQYKVTTGFFSENTIVVAEGEMLVEGIFQHHLLACCYSVACKDGEKVMGKLETVLDGFESVEVVPSLFVFMGNFSSRPCNLSFHTYSTLRLQFGKLGQIIAAHSRLIEHSRFLFIPGPDDAGPSTSLPRCALPKYLTEELQKHIPNAIFSSNPCRVKFYSQEIVFFREDMLYRMRRSCLMPPSEEETNDPFQHLVATITHQSHLCPLPLTVQPIIWTYDHCLYLYPTPHTIVLGDSSQQKAFKYTGITCFNTGSFSIDSTFVVYRPCSQEVELSAL